MFDDGQSEENGRSEQPARVSTTAEEIGSHDHNDLTRVMVGRSASTGKRKKKAASRLSFGPGEISSEAGEELEDSELFTPKKSDLGRKVRESNALRKSLPAYQIPIRGGEDEEERPTYSKDYLNALKSSTPSTPKDLWTSHTPADDEDGLDESELDGAVIVNTNGEAVPEVSIPTEAEIREKKERRARLAHEQDFISLNDDSDDNSRQQLSLIPGKKKPKTRLVREDEDIAEGFDSFVDDGPISLGKKAEKRAKRQQRITIAEMIEEAQSDSSEGSDWSESERRRAFESAQTRAGMDGLSKPDPASAALPPIPPKITPLPNLSECLRRLQNTLSGMQQELERRTKKMEGLQREKAEILAREEEVQRLLKEAGDRYAAMRAESNLPAVGVDAGVLGAGKNEFMDAMAANRGLESLGNTPTARPRVDDVG